MGQVISMELLVLPEEPGDYVARSLLWCMATLYALLYASPPFPMSMHAFFVRTRLRLSCFRSGSEPCPAQHLVYINLTFPLARPSFGVYYSWHVYR